MSSDQPAAIGVLTSGGDAPGMNAALRAVVRAALDRGVRVYAIREGYHGMVYGGEQICEMSWNDVGGIMHQGGTVIGTARCAEFRSREGRLRAAYNLVQRGIDRLVVIGGDGSLTGASVFRTEWPGLLAELVAQGQIDQAAAGRHPYLSIVGLVGSIDNDMYGTDMTIGVDSALHRITAAIDALTSTAASHQRTFVVEVMGRACGYLALMGAIAGGADWVFIPESPPDVDNWAERMCEVLRAGRAAGRRDSIVVVAEGAHDRVGNPISSEQVRRVLEDHLGEDTRVTILGHVQRGGSPSAFDRWMSTLIGYTAVDELLAASAESEPQLIGMRYNRITRQPLMHCVEQTHAVGQAIAAQEYTRAMALRGGSFTEMFHAFQGLAQALPALIAQQRRCWRLAVLHAGEPAPGMNTAVRAAVRLGLSQGYCMLGVQDGFDGLIAGRLRDLGWADVEGWESMGGAELGTSSSSLSSNDLAAVAHAITQQRIDALMVIGGWPAYEGAYRIYSERKHYASFNIPMIVIPAAIENNLPGSELSIGADTALNNIVDAVDKIKQSAVAAHRCFVVEVMGSACGYLALMGGLASGAERVYLPEEGVALRDLMADIDRLVRGFQAGKRLGLLIRNEAVHPVYTTGFMRDLFDEEGGKLFETRQAVLGHLQQGGNPAPFDRIQATRLAVRSLAFLTEELEHGTAASAFIGVRSGRVEIFRLDDMPGMVDAIHRRPRDQWWLELRPIARVLAQPGPSNAFDPGTGV